MNGYMKAGFHRILRRKSRYITLAVIYALFGLIVYYMSKDTTIYKTADLVSQYLGFTVIIFGLVELSYVLNEDIASKSMQIAIGCGTSRRKLVLNEWMEIFLLVGLDTLLLLAVICAACAFGGHVFVGEPLRDVSIMFLFRWIGTGIAVMFSMMISFPRQATGFANLVFLVYASGIINSLLGAMLTFGPLSDLNVGSWLPDNLLGVAESRMVTGNFALPQLLGALVYLVLFYEITCRLFARKELEF